MVGAKRKRAGQFFGKFTRRAEQQVGVPFLYKKLVIGNAAVFTAGILVDLLVAYVGVKISP
ncbi:hypothetical protein D3C87_1711830 [compost metagenome]